MAGSAGIVGGGSCGMGAPGDVGSALAGGMVGSAGASCAWTGAAIMSARALADNSVRVLTLSCDRQRVDQGKSVSVRVDLGVRRLIQSNPTDKQHHRNTSTQH